MRKLIIGLLLILLTACSANTGGSGGSDFETDMQEVYNIINEAFEDDLRALTDKEKDKLSYLLYSKEHDINSDSDGFSFQLAMRSYEIHYSGYQIGTSGYEELMDAQSNADKYFE